MCGTAPITDPPAHANVLPRDRIRGEIDITSPEHIQSLQMLFIRNMRKSKIEENIICSIIKKNFDLTPNGIIKHLDLLFHYLQI